jgi:hypothetical protein
MSKANFLFDDYDESDDENNFEIVEELKSYVNNQQKRRKKHNEYHTVPLVEELTPELIEKRNYYANNFPAAHMDIFTNSTGIKPLGPVQIDSSTHTQRILDSGGKLLKLEPRGFGKTSRTSNELIIGVLSGKCTYPLLLASSKEKANDILEGIKAELVHNDELYDLYPQVCECFRRLEERSQKAPNQLFDGQLTYIKYAKDHIVIPFLPGNPASGAMIRVRSKDNVRGTNTKVREGPMKGRVLRPDVIFMDDLQTDMEAASPTSVGKIINTIKKSILRAGTHSKKLKCIFAATPICEGDVPHHFYFNEPAWECVSYKMLEQLPNNIDMWLGEYRRRLLSFSRKTPGAAIKARIAALQYYQENFEKMNEGAQPSWEWAYEWQDDPQVEITAIQHAMNILIEEGEEVFQTECQTRLQVSTNIEGFSRTPKELIQAKQHSLPRNYTSVEARKIVSHIDVHLNYLTFMTVASTNVMKPEIINYGTFPPQPSHKFSKKHIINTLKKRYPDIDDPVLRIYQGVKDCINSLGRTIFFREDGIEITHDLILVDSRYQTDEVRRGIRDSDYKTITLPHSGVSVFATDKPIDMRTYSAGCEVFHENVIIPVKHTGQLSLHTNVFYYKTLVHRGFAARLGLPGSISLFVEEFPHQHSIVAEHCWAEVPKIDVNEKEKREIIVWEETDEDNELFDNLVGCISGLIKEGCTLYTPKERTKVIDIQELINQQREES